METCTLHCSCDYRLEKPQFKVGDKVYSLINGWGFITDISYCIRVAKTMTSPSSIGYHLDGSYFTDGSVVLYHNKPTIIPAKKKVKKWRFAYQTGSRGVCSETYYTEEEAKSWEPKQSVKLPWTEIEVEE